jgi:hypothetical protein
MLKCIVSAVLTDFLALSLGGEQFVGVVLGHDAQSRRIVVTQTNGEIHEISWNLACFIAERR